MDLFVDRQTEKWVDVQTDRQTYTKNGIETDIKQIE
jgi:hypothetical protein